MWFGFPFRNQVWILATEKIKLPDRQDSELFGEAREAMIAKYSCPKRHGVGELAPEARAACGSEASEEAARRSDAHCLWPGTLIPARQATAREARMRRTA